MNIRHAAICMLISIVCTGCATKKEPLTISGQFGHAPLGFEMHIPNEWRAELSEELEPGDTSLSISMRDPDNEAVILFSARSGVLTAKEAALIDIEQYRADKRHTLVPLNQGSWDNGRLHGYTVDDYLKKKDHKTYQRRIYIDNDPAVYTFILQAPAQEVVDIYEPELQALIDSFTLSPIEE